MSTNIAATSTPPEIPAAGFCIHLQRMRQEQRSKVSFPRTVGDYQCYWNKQPIEGLSGQMVERGGPGDNGGENGLRVKHGKYRLAIQSGKYKTYGYAAAGRPYPALALDGADPEIERAF